MPARQKKYPFEFTTQYGLGFDPQDDEMVVDFFCGGSWPATYCFEYGEGWERYNELTP